MTDWLPIASAPKDEAQIERLLGYCPRDGIKIMRYSGWGGGTGPFEYEVSGRGEHCDCGWDDYYPTHWQHLPKPPTTSAP